MKVTIILDKDILVNGDELYNELLWSMKQRESLKDTSWMYKSFVDDIDFLVTFLNYHNYKGFEWLFDDNLKEYLLSKDHDNFCIGYELIRGMNVVV